MDDLPDMKSLRLSDLVEQPRPNQNAVMNNKDLLLRIIGALEAENSESIDNACERVTNWCATSPSSCNEDIWRSLLLEVFEWREYTAAPKAMFTKLCRRWNRGRKARYDALLASFKEKWPNDPPSSLKDHKEMMTFLQSSKVSIYHIGSQDFVNSLGGEPTDRPVWVLCAYLTMYNTPALLKLLENGYLHVSQTLDPLDDPQTKETRPRPNTLLGLTVLSEAPPEHVEALLNLGADPNTPPVQTNRDDYRSSGGPAEVLAKRHIQLLASGEAVMGRRDLDGKILDIFKLLYEYGGDVLNAAMVYRAHSMHFNGGTGGTKWESLADTLENEAKYAIYQKGAWVRTPKMSSDLLSYHKTSMDDRGGMNWYLPLMPAAESGLDVPFAGLRV